MSCAMEPASELTSTTCTGTVNEPSAFWMAVLGVAWIAVTFIALRMPSERPTM